MKCLCFLLLVAVSHAYVTRVERGTKDIPIPTITRLTAIDPPGFVANWTPVESRDSSDPILGYKVKVWEQERATKYHYVTFHGNQMLVEENIPLQFPNANKIPKGDPTEYIVRGEENTSLKVDHIKIGVTYEIRVQAFTNSGDGPLSLPMRIQLLTNLEDQEKNMYTVE